MLKKNPDSDSNESITSNIDVHKIHITFFTNFAAATKTEKDLTLPELHGLILKTSGPTKEKLPWLKLACFGEKKTDKGSLRHDANVTGTTGIELDYDGEQKISFDAAVTTLREMKCRGIVYATPSHTPELPRWRLLLPTSETLPNDMRNRLAHRVNGFFGCVFKGESFVLSQSFYYGKAKDNAAADHRGEIIDGAFVDLQDNICRFELAGTPKDKADAANNPFTDYGGGRAKGRGFENILAELGDGPNLKGFHEVLIAAASSYMATNPDADRELLKKILKDAIDKAPKDDTPQRKAKNERYVTDDYLDDIIESGATKFAKLPEGGTLKDFVAYLPQHNYIYVPTREPWVRGGVNASLPPMPLLKPDGTPALDKKGNATFISASAWIDKNQPVKQITWAPGEPMLIRDRLVSNGGWIAYKGDLCFNLYRPPTIIHGNAADVGPWLDHIKRIYPTDHEHIVDWFAHRVQRPAEKINHALLLGGGQGIGKDTILEPVKRAVGPWNFEEVSPTSMLGRFNGFLKSVILRVNEVRDLGDVNRYAFYEHMKPYTASPPDVLRVDEKNLRDYTIFNCCGVVETTNHKLDGIYLPPDDRRTYVAWSNAIKEEFTEEYWDSLWNWFNAGGDRNVAAYLAKRDISKFNPKKPPFKTAAWHAIVDANIAPEEGEMTDALEFLNNPDAVTLAMLDGVAIKVGGDFYAWLNDRKNNRAVPHKIGVCGYTAVRNPDSQRHSTRWRVGRVPQVVYAKATLTERDRIAAVRGLSPDGGGKGGAGADQQADQQAAEVDWENIQQNQRRPR